MEKIRLEEALRQYEEFLERKGMRLTRQRRTILERLYNLDCHVSADDLADTLRQEDTGISKATVYRTLSLLEESGLVEANDFRRGYRVYEFAHVKNRHDHILCVDGETVIEFQSDEIKELLTRIARSYGFEPISHTLTIYARCEACKDGDGHAHSHGDKSHEPAEKPRKTHNEIQVRPKPASPKAPVESVRSRKSKVAGVARNPMPDDLAGDTAADDDDADDRSAGTGRKRYSDRVSKQERRARLSSRNSRTG